MTDEVGKRNLWIKYCPIDKMWGYFMTNPTQGAKLSKFITYLLGGNE